MYTLFKFFDATQDTIDSLVDQAAKSLANTDVEAFYGMKDIKTTDTSYIIKVTIPGFEREEISLSVVGDILTVEGKVADKSVKSIKRVYYIPTDADKEKIDAALKNGILTVTLPKKVETRVRIDIK